MNEHKHGEPWEVFDDYRIKDKDGNNVADIFDADITQRAVLCVNACAEFEDWEVGRIADNYLEWQKWETRHLESIDTLKADLADAVRLLERAKRATLLKPLHEDLTDFLKKQNKGV